MRKFDAELLFGRHGKGKQTSCSTSKKHFFLARQKFVFMVFLFYSQRGNFKALQKISPVFV